MANIEHSSFSGLGGSFPLGAFTGPLTIIHDTPPPVEPSDPPDPDPADLLENPGYSRLGGSPGLWAPQIASRWSYTSRAVGVQTSSLGADRAPQVAGCTYNVRGVMGRPVIEITAPESGEATSGLAYVIPGSHGADQIIRIHRSGFAGAATPDSYLFSVSEDCSATIEYTRDDGGNWQDSGYMRVGTKQGTTYSQLTLKYAYDGTKFPVTHTLNCSPSYSGYYVQVEAYGSTPFDYTLTIRL